MSKQKHPRSALSTEGEFDPPGASSLGEGLAGALQRLERSERPFDYAPGDVPPVDCNLRALAKRKLVPPPGPIEDKAFTDFAMRSRNLARKMAADPATTELEFLHARLVMALRRRDPPAAARDLFLRMWHEEGLHLAETLPTRWRVSAAQTFADHGTTETDRKLGAEIALLFGMVKLYETERRFSGLPGWKVFPAPRPQPGPLPLGLEPFGIADGDLAGNLLARIWRRALDAGPSAMALLARVLLDELERSNRTVLRRLAKMRAGSLSAQD
jgi:hypothetical protein